MHISSAALAALTLPGTRQHSTRALSAEMRSCSGKGVNREVEEVAVSGGVVRDGGVVSPDVWRVVKSLSASECWVGFEARRVSAAVRLIRDTGGWCGDFAGDTSIFRIDPCMDGVSAGERSALTDRLLVSCSSSIGALLLN